MISTKDGSICIDCGSNRCLVLIRALNCSTELHAYSINASQCFGIARSPGNENYSVAVFTLGYDGVILNSRAVVNQQISLDSNAESPNGTIYMHAHIVRVTLIMSFPKTENVTFAMVGVSSQCLYIGIVCLRPWTITFKQSSIQL